MQEWPDIVLKRKRLSKTKTVVLFRRNNLTFDAFQKTRDGYFYEEYFKFHGVRGRIKIIVHSDSLYDLFSINTKTVKIKGGKNGFGILLRFGDQKKLPLNKRGFMGCVMYELDCEGKELIYDGKTKNGQEVDMHDTQKRSSIIIPANISWAAKHPLQGGGFSPR